MKLLLSLFIAAAFIITVSGQDKKPNPKKYIALHNGMGDTLGWVKRKQLERLFTPFTDTPRAKYLKFYTIRIDTIEYLKARDTLLIARNLLGDRLFKDETIFWQEAVLRSIQVLDNRVKRDSVKIQGGNK